MADTSPHPGFSPLQDNLSTPNLVQREPTQLLPSPTDSDQILLQANSQAVHVEDTDDYEMEQSSSKRRSSSPNHEFDNDVLSNS